MNGLKIEAGKEYLVDFDNEPYFKAGDVFLVCRRYGPHFIIQFDHGEVEEVPPHIFESTKLTEVKSF